MSSFAAKRKARVIKVDEDEASDGSSSSGMDVAASKEGEALQLFFCDFAADDIGRLIKVLPRTIEAFVWFENRAKAVPTVGVAKSL